METTNVASLRSKGEQALKTQKQQENAVIMKSLILTLDTLVEALVDRLENPNKSFGFIGSPSPASETDTKFAECVLDIKSQIGSVLPYRALFGTSPPQYEKLRTLLDKVYKTGNKKDKYLEKRVEFFYRFQQMLITLEQGGYINCQGYPRISNLFKGTTTGEKYKFDFKGILEELSTILRKVDNAIERKEIDEVASMALSLSALESAKAMPNVPSGIEEPSPNIQETDITTELTSPAPVQKSELTNADKMKIAGIAAQLTSKFPEKVKGMTTDQIRQHAENIYRRKIGKGRKTYRKKKFYQKSRKIRHV